MAMGINTNVSSLNSQRQLTSSQSSLATSLQRLSSGLRINSAKDDAAGLAISDRMSSQIKGLNQAARNANDGISLAQTAEGALQGVGDALQRMRELAVQASNATNSASDRASLQKEVDQLVQQINTISSQTSFNGVKLLDGTFNSQSFQVGANKGETINISSIASAKADSLGVGTTSSYSTTVSAGNVVAGGITAGGITVNGYGIGPSLSDGVSYAPATSVTGTAASAATDATTATTAGGTDFAINGVTIGQTTVTGMTNASDAGAAIAATINGYTNQTGVTATADASGNISLTSASGGDVKIAGTITGTGLTAATTYGAGSTTSAISKAAAFNAVSGQTGVTAKANATTASGAAIGTNTGAIDGGTTDYIQINGVKLGAIAAGADAGSQASNVVAAINTVSNQTGVTATFDSTGKITMTAADGRNINVQGGGTGLTNSGLSAGTTFGGVELTTTGQNGITLGGTDIARAGLTSQSKAATATYGAGVAAIDLSTAAGAQNALSTIDSALATVNDSRANLGAIQNRFTSVVANLSTTSENLSAARGRIQDTDFAAETANMTKAQILQQAGTAMLAQANQLPQSVLSLLK
ncbi:MAG: flagellin [Zoogloea sp.]|uniref:flagellin N-terminal helical domain-containing protein n=1 Tax=Zoogloea sp. TaxID=49181 RepID=UPI002636BD32|nr:flagellin [Zoogloea sp.]MDD3328275.1 flagellin [Zoogloea sp.]